MKKLISSLFLSILILILTLLLSLSILNAQPAPLAVKGGGTGSNSFNCGIVSASGTTPLKVVNIGTGLVFNCNTNTLSATATSTASTTNSISFASSTKLLTSNVNGVVATTTIDITGGGSGINNGLPLDVIIWTNDKGKDYVSDVTIPTFDATVISPSQPYQSALAWTFAPGTTFPASFVNDVEVLGTDNLGRTVSGVFTGGANPFIGQTRADRIAGGGFVSNTNYAMKWRAGLPATASFWSDSGTAGVGNYKIDTLVPGNNVTFTADPNNAGRYIVSSGTSTVASTSNFIATNPASNLITTVVNNATATENLQVGEIYTRTLQNLPVTLNYAQSNTNITNTTRTFTFVGGLVSNKSIYNNSITATNGSAVLVATGTIGVDVVAGNYIELNNSTPLLKIVSVSGNNITVNQNWTNTTRTFTNYEVFSNNFTKTYTGLTTPLQLQSAMAQAVVDANLNFLPNYVANFATPTTVVVVNTIFTPSPLSKSPKNSLGEYYIIDETFLPANELRYLLYNQNSLIAPNWVASIYNWDTDFQTNLLDPEILRLQAFSGISTTSPAFNNQNSQQEYLPSIVTKGPTKTLNIPPNAIFVRKASGFNLANGSFITGGLSIPNGTPAQFATGTVISWLDQGSLQYFVIMGNSGSGASFAVTLNTTPAYGGVGAIIYNTVILRSLEIGSNLTITNGVLNSISGTSTIQDYVRNTYYSYGKDINIGTADNFNSNFGAVGTTTFSIQAGRTNSDLVTTATIPVISTVTDAVGGGVLTDGQTIVYKKNGANASTIYTNTANNPSVFSTSAGLTNSVSAGVADDFSFEIGGTNLLGYTININDTTLGTVASGNINLVYSTFPYAVADEITINASATRMAINMQAGLTNEISLIQFFDITRTGSTLSFTKTNEMVLRNNTGNFQGIPESFAYGDNRIVYGVDLVGDLYTYNGDTGVKTLIRAGFTGDQSVGAGDTQTQFVKGMFIAGADNGSVNIYNTITGTVTYSGTGLVPGVIYEVYAIGLSPSGIITFVGNNTAKNATYISTISFSPRNVFSAPVDIGNNPIQINGNSPANSILANNASGTPEWIGRANQVLFTRNANTTFFTGIETRLLWSAPALTRTGTFRYLSINADGNLANTSSFPVEVSLSPDVIVSTTNAVEKDFWFQLNSNVVSTGLRYAQTEKFTSLAILGKQLSITLQPNDAISMWVWSSGGSPTVTGGYGNTAPKIVVIEKQA